MAEKAVAKTPQAPAPRSRDVYGSFRNEMDRLVDSFFGGGFLPRRFLDWPASAERDLVPEIDLSEDADGFRVTAELPGLDPKDVEVTLADGLLTMKGEKKSESKTDKDNLHITERRYGSFLRSIRLPDTIDENKVKASFDKGVLTVRVAKKPEAVKAPKKIAISQSS